MYTAAVLMLLIFGSLAVPRDAHAIIFLPALILIPIAKFVAIILAGFAIPTMGIGALAGKMFRLSRKQTIAAILSFLFIAAVCLGLFLKLHDPSRPMF